MKTTPRNRILAFLLIALTGCLADLLTKHYFFEKLLHPDDNGGQVWWMWEPYFGFQTSVNHGALFGFGSGQVWIFACFSIVALTGIGYWLYTTRNSLDWLSTIALAAVTGGILGNLHDRLGLWSAPLRQGIREYGVRDWIYFQWRGWVWPNFNIADSLLVCGVGLLIVHAIRSGPKVASESAVTTGQG